jgi:regulator of cell morphogenesis and NO signaling
MSDTTTVLPLAEADLAAMTIRDLIAIEPRALEILAPYGIDLCCGGGHPLGEALDLHGVDRRRVLARLAGLAAGERA